MKVVKADKPDSVDRDGTVTTYWPHTGKRKTMTYSNGRVREFYDTGCEKPIPKEKPERGRTKGAKNIVTRSMKNSILETFELIGGVKHLAMWASENPSDFYTKVWIKLLPVDIEVKADVNVTQATSAIDWIDSVVSTIYADSGLLTPSESPGISAGAINSSVTPHNPWGNNETVE